MTELASASPLRWFRRQILPILANLRLAILLLLLIATTSAIGTVIEQHESLDFYQANYPEDPALLGFLSWKVILGVGLNDVYKTWWFLSLLVLFGSSLAACTFTRQLPALKAARNWTFYRKPRQFKKLALAGSLPIGEDDTANPSPNLDQVQESLEQRRYQVFRDGDSLYARKGLIGRIAPIVVHASMLLILGGGHCRVRHGGRGPGDDSQWGNRPGHQLCRGWRLVLSRSLSRLVSQSQPLLD